MDVKESYRADPDFAQLLHTLIFQEMSGDAKLVKEQDPEMPPPAKLFLKFGKQEADSE